MRNVNVRRLAQLLFNFGVCCGVVLRFTPTCTSYRGIAAETVDRISVSYSVTVAI